MSSYQATFHIISLTLAAIILSLSSREGSLDCSLHLENNGDFYSTDAGQAKADFETWINKLVTDEEPLSPLADHDDLWSSQYSHPLDCIPEVRVPRQTTHTLEANGPYRSLYILCICQKVVFLYIADCVFIYSFFYSGTWPFYSADLLSPKLVEPVGVGNYVWGLFSQWALNMFVYLSIFGQAS